VNYDQFFLLGAFLVQLVGMLSAGIWFVTSVKITTAELRTTIDHLSRSIETLGKTIERIEAKQQEHEIQFARMETNNQRSRER
jgi:hypothetical protein